MVEDDLGIPDRDSWLLRSMYPTGTARGWRRTGCIAMLVGAALVCLLAVVLTLAFGTDEGASDDAPCDQLAIELTYLEAVRTPTPEVRAEIADHRQRQTELGC